MTEDLQHQEQQEEQSSTSKTTIISHGRTLIRPLLSEYGVQSIDDLNIQGSFFREPVQHDITFRGQEDHCSRCSVFSCDHLSNTSECSLPASKDSAAWLSKENVSESNTDLIVPRVTIHRSNHRSNEKIQGQGIGYLRILVCGDSGIGKSTLIEAMMHLPEFYNNDATDDDTDSLALPSIITDLGEEGLDDDLQILQSDGIHEHFTSTAMLPSWESVDAEIDHDSDLLSKNICFIDTPGYGSCLDAGDVISSVRSYIERQFEKTNSMLNPACPDTMDIMRLVHNSHGAHTHVDACLYLVFGRLKKVDIEYLRAVDGLCNVIPVIVKSDLLTQERERELRLDVLQQLRNNDIEIFDFGYAYDELMNLCSKLDPSVPPFALSNLEISARQLTCLKDALLYTHIDDLRHATAAKFVEWRQLQVPDMRSAIDLSMLTTAESVDRIQAFRKRAAQNMNMRISHYVSEKRKSMERSMYEREEALRKELGSVEGRKRAAILMNELNKLLQDDSFDVKSFPSTTPSASTLTAMTSNTSDLLTSSRRSGESDTVKKPERRLLGTICLGLLIVVLITGFPLTTLCSFPSLTWLPACNVGHGYRV